MNEAITEAANNSEKYKTYKYLKGRYKKAVADGFYLEALLIDYAMIEDRLQSYLYHMGIVSERDSRKVCNKAKENIRKEMCDAEKDESISVSSISAKIELVRKILDWASETDKDYTTNKYLKTLKSQLESADIAYITETLDKILVWKEYRNQVIHGLMNKNLDSVNENIKGKVLEGMSYVDDLDSQIRYLKKGNLIRRSARLFK